MIKYISYDSFDEYGQHIIPVDSVYSMNKTASSYSPELMKVIANMKRDPNLYYVVINAVGSAEVWGANRNGDSFPKDGLTHLSTRTDMGTPSDYGYKTFEYYAKLYYHHVNKNPEKSFGEVIFSHWNPILHRVELIVGINRVKAKDMVDSLEKGDPVGVSMGCRVPYDVCSICGNKAATRKQYCNHLKENMLSITTPEQARLWSTQTGTKVVAGTQVCAINTRPKFFDISKVYVGADRTAFVLGKAAKTGMINYSADMAEAEGVTDEMIEKLSHIGKMSFIKKKSDIDKEVGSFGPNETDGAVIPCKDVSVVRRALDEKMMNAIRVEPTIPNSQLDTFARAMPLNVIMSTMLGMGIQPKPREFQRIVLIRSGESRIADELDKQKIVFDHTDDSNVEDIDVSNANFNDLLSKALVQYLTSRSSAPGLIEQRISDPTVKLAKLYSSTTGTDYWDRVGDNPVGIQESEYKIDPRISASLAGIAALYAGLKMRGMGYSVKSIGTIFTQKPWLTTFIGAGVMNRIMDKAVNTHEYDNLFLPASKYEGVLQNTNFSGVMKKVAMLKSASSEAIQHAAGNAIIAGAATMPIAHIVNSYNIKTNPNKKTVNVPAVGGAVGGVALLGSLLSGRVVGNMK